VSLYLLVTFYATMVVAGLVVETLFGILGLVPDQRNAKVIEASVTWNYTTFLNIAFLVLTAVLVVRFLRTGGPAMLRMMGRPLKQQPAANHVQGHGLHGAGDAGAGDAEYVCPMHPEVVSLGPGRCPKCGMELKPRDISDEN
jgi:hypothetical protein